MPAAFVIGDSRDADLPAITAIDGHHVLHGFASFEETPPALAEMARRRAELLARGLPTSPPPRRTGCCSAIPMPGRSSPVRSTANRWRLDLHRV